MFKKGGFFDKAGSWISNAASKVGGVLGGLSKIPDVLRGTADRIDSGISHVETQVADSYTRERFGVSLSDSKSLFIFGGFALVAILLIKRK